MSKGEQTRSAILSEAIKLASIQGLDGISIGGLAARMKLSKSGLFGHFGSKEALQQAILEAVAERFVGQVIRPALQQPRGEQRLRAFFDNWLAWVDNDILPGGCPLMGAALELDDRPGPLRDYLASQQSQFIRTLERMAQTAVSQGAFRQDVDIHQFAFDLYGIGIGYSIWLRLLRDADAKHRAAVAFEALLARVRI